MRSRAAGFVALVAVTVGGFVLPAAAEAPPRGTPVRRTFEKIYPVVLPEQKARFQSAGYASFLKGVALEDLFEIPTSPPHPSDTVLDHTTARFSHVETGCILRTLPSPITSNVTFTTTKVRATQCLFYDETPSDHGRRWGGSNLGTFHSDTLVAVYEIEDETDAIDLASRVGSGHAVARLSCSTPVTLPSGKTLDFATDYGSALFAEFQFATADLSTTAIDPSDALGGVLVTQDAGIWTVLDRDEDVPPCAEVDSTVLCPHPACPSQPAD